MEELKDEMELIRRMQLAPDELDFVSKCDSINEQTPLSRTCRFLGKHPLFLFLIYLAVLFCLYSIGSNATVSYSYWKNIVNSINAASVFFFVFCWMFCSWIIVKKLSMRNKYLEQKLDKARSALK